MELLLNNILNLTEEEIDNSKIEFNMQAGSGGQLFLDRWLKHTDEEKELEHVRTALTGDGMETEKFLSWTMGFSFARMQEDEWLLISAAKIINTPANDWANVQVLEEYAPLFGRLIIKCKKEIHSQDMYLICVSTSNKLL